METREDTKAEREREMKIKLLQSLATAVLEC